MKQIPLSQLAQLKKIMGMTTSAHDGESLAAIRKANAILKEHSLTWADVLDRSVSVEQRMTMNTSYDDMSKGTRREYGGPDFAGATHESANVAEMIRSAFDELRGVEIRTEGFRLFIQSLEEQFQRTGYLSPAQRAPLMKAVQRYRERTRREA